MKKGKLYSILVLSSFLLIFSSLIAINTNATNDRTISAWCHVQTNGISITFLNQTVIGIPHATSFNLSFYASTTYLGGATFRIRALVDYPTGIINFTPLLEQANTGIADGGPGDPDGVVNNKIGNATNPATIRIWNIPDNYTAFQITILALDASDEGQPYKNYVIIGTSPPETWEAWFWRTQMPIIIGIVVAVLAGVIISVLLKKRKKSNKVN